MELEVRPLVDYGGDRHSRDGAYHQYTVWGWLIGPFVSAYVRANGGTADVRNQATDFIAPFQTHL
jgi:glycogen debranching enzyme